MKLDELLYGIPCEPVGAADAADTEVAYLCYDSRRASSGALFVALSGAHADGHEFAERAYSFGCRAFLCERPVPLPADAAVFLTPNTRQALGALSRAFFGHPERSLVLIGITGTKGKTTTALMTCAILNAAGHPCGYIGSNGVEYAGRHLTTENTTPESYDLTHYLRLMADAGITHVVLEVSSQALFTYRVEGLQFDACGFTNLYHDHIGRYEHPNFDHYRASKRRLFAEHGAKFIAYCADDAASPYMIKGSGALCAGFGLEHEAAFTATDIEKYRTDSVLGVSFVLHTAAGAVPVRLPTPGKFSVYNALCAAAIADWYGVPLSLIADALAHCTPKGRFEVVPALDDATFIIDYAHNGVSLRHALSVLREYGPKRLICLFGSVGGRTVERRQELAEVSGELADFSIITTDNPDGEAPMKIIAEIERHLPDSAPHVCIPSRAEAIRYAVEHAEPGDVVLLAGKGHETYQLVRGEKLPFSEREYLLQYAQELRAEHAFHPRSEKQFL